MYSYDDFIHSLDTRLTWISTSQYKVPLAVKVTLQTTSDSKRALFSCWSHLQRPFWGITCQLALHLDSVGSPS